MQWLIDNWLLLALGGGMVAFHLVGHGKHGRHGASAGGGGGGCCGGGGKQEASAKADAEPSQNSPAERAGAERADGR
jgi:hypothetical protein